MFQDGTSTAMNVIRYGGSPLGCGNLPSLRHFGWMVRRFSSGGGTSGVERALLSAPGSRGTNGCAAGNDRDSTRVARQACRGLRAAAE